MKIVVCCIIIKTSVTLLAKPAVLLNRKLPYTQLLLSRRLLLLSFILLISQVGWSQVRITLPTGQQALITEEDFDLLPYCQWLPECIGVGQEIAQVDSLARSGRFRSGGLLLADSCQAYWWRFELLNLGPQARRFYVRVNQSTLNAIYRAGETGSGQKNGSNVLITEASFPSLYNFLTISLPPNTRSVFYLKISRPYQSGQLKIQLQAPAPVDQWIERAKIEDWVILGALGGMLLYNLLLFWLLKEHSYLYYSLYNLGAIGWICLDTILAYALPPIAGFYFEVPIGRGFIVVFQVAYLGFIRCYFETEVRFPSWDRLLKWLQWFYVPLVVLLAVEWQQQRFIFSEWLLLFGGALVCMVAFSLGIWAWRTHYAPAKYYLGASFLLVIGVGLVVVGHISDPSGVFFRKYAASIFKFALVVESVLFAFALASRYVLLKAEVEQKKRENERMAEEKQLAIRAVVEQKNVELEQKVHERTRELREANEAKDKLMAIIGHDLRSPVASVQLGLSIMAEEPLPEELAELVQGLGGEVSRLRQTIDNLLNWSYAQRQGIVTQAHSLNLALLAEEKIKLFQPIAKTKGITLHNQMPAFLPAFADPQQIRLVLRNLLGNALKFTHSGGRVVLTGEINERGAQFRVTDNGIGMSPENVNKLFNLTTHFTERGTAGESGTGLGLLMCKEMVERNGGTITVISQLGHGTTFLVALPVAAPSPLPVNNE